MNAYELADKLESFWLTKNDDLLIKTVTMLRQQADRIAELEKAPTKYCPSENNAAYEKGVIDGMAKMAESAVHRAVEGMAIKELSDEEIQEISHDFGEIAWLGETTYNFARAILKKASEK
jgi:hypothetical protein